MSQVVLSRTMFELVVKHLVDIEEERERILVEYYPNLTKERDHFQGLINQYISRLEAILGKAKVEDSDAIACPFIMIGGVVELDNLTFGETERIEIISPFLNKTNTSEDCASYLSPLGSALLLKQENEEVSINTPAGTINYRVNSVKFPMC